MRNFNTGGWGGAGSSVSFEILEGPVPDTHWYNVREEWIENPMNPVHWLNGSWRNALSSPGKAFQQIYPDGWSFAFYSEDRKQILSTWYQCPMRHYHHLYQTCGCCGQYG